MSLGGSAKSVTVAGVAHVVLAVAGRPRLWATALRQWRRTTPRGWWKRRPFLPLPSRDYLAFRMITQYGSADHRIEPGDVLNYLAWCQLQDAAAS